MIITKMSQNDSFFIKNKVIHNLGVAFDISYRFDFNSKQIAVKITYKINLIENYEYTIGRINCVYRFLIDNKFDQERLKHLEENIVRLCLKENHYNIKDLIEEALKHNQLTPDIVIEDVMS